MLFIINNKRLRIAFNDVYAQDLRNENENNTGWTKKNAFIPKFM